MTIRTHPELVPFYPDHVAGRVCINSELVFISVDFPLLPEAAARAVQLQAGVQYRLTGCARRWWDRRIHRPSAHRRACSAGRAQRSAVADLAAIRMAGW